MASMIKGAIANSIEDTIEKDVINTIYKAVVLSLLIIVYAALGKKIFKLDVGKVIIEEIVKLTGVVAAAQITKRYLVKHCLPAEIVK